VSRERFLYLLKPYPAVSDVLKAIQHYCAKGNFRRAATRKYRLILPNLSEDTFVIVLYLLLNQIRRILESYLRSNLVTKGGLRQLSKKLPAGTSRCVAPPAVQDSSIASTNEYLVG